MKVQMLKTEQAAPNGYKVISYLKDEIVELPEKIAKAFLEMKVAKMIEVVPENKAVENAQQVKKEKKVKKEDSKDETEEEDIEKKGFTPFFRKDNKEED